MEVYGYGEQYPARGSHECFLKKSTSFFLLARVKIRNHSAFVRCDSIYASRCPDYGNLKGARMLIRYSPSSSTDDLRFNFPLLLLEDIGADS
mmetsp:Transcript_10144/g.17369  ORF Transcript_10144/g.17369 Transcript_10144/m.17369 type:complete len:92 (+) Transcript_10144:1129-1404(+)